MINITKTNIISLNGIWKLCYYNRNNVFIKTPDDIAKAGLYQIDAKVPGNVELDLLNTGIIPEPFYADNINLLKEYEACDWIYLKKFESVKYSNKQKVILNFKGVDCLADYWLNGQKIGSSDNMMIEHKFDVTDILNCGSENILAVIIRSPVIKAMSKKYYPYMSALPTNFEQLWIRKAPHCYGWDIMPRAVSAGIWRSVELEVHNENEIEELYISTISAEYSAARINIFFKIKLQPELLGRLELSIKGKCGDSTFTAIKKVEFVAGHIQVTVLNPKLWWPSGYGAPDIYEVKAELLYEGNIIDTMETHTGIRTAYLERVERKATSDTGKFIFKVNGIPIMCKGTNWVPLDAFHSRDAERYNRAMDLVTEANCNIIRCWGGNVYEDHTFFDLCDRNGIMVWQDFAMACGAYPQNDDFYKVIANEAESVVKKLRNHPSLIVWCGDNECDYNYFNRKFDPGKNRITREILPAVVFSNDPNRNFIISSPYFSPEVITSQNTKLLTEDHLWGPRDYYKSRYYTESEANFVGEAGYHGCPSLSSIKCFIDEEHLWPWKDNLQWLTHCTAPQGKGSAFSYRIELMANQIQELFGAIPDNIDDFIIASQISQAEAKKFFIENTRVKKWKRSGIIWWNILDGWPQFSDAVVDYYFGKKLAFYYIKRSQQSFCIMIDEHEAWNFRVIAGNDTNLDATGTYKIYDADTNEVVMKGSFFVKANENAVLGRIRASMGEHKLYLIEWDVNGNKHGNHYLAGYPPFSLPDYKRWLENIAALPESFDLEQIGK